MNQTKQKHTKLLSISLASLAVLLIAMLIWVKFGGSGQGVESESEEAQPTASTDSGDATVDAEAGAGSVTDHHADSGTRPADRVANQADDELSESKKSLEGTWLDYGETPAVTIDANEQITAAAEAIRTGQYPERLNVAVGSPSARTFDPDKFSTESEQFDQEYRDAYLASPEPGRVWHPAQPGPGVPRIRPLIKPYVTIKQGEEVMLRVSGLPGQPVTFTSFDLGMFENQLTTIAVVTNDQGVAEARFVGTPGTSSDVSIMAASPVTSGQARLTVYVVGPNDSVSDRR